MVFQMQRCDFVRTNLSIAELQPFEETLADAINIAGAYGIPAVLVPRKDQSTFYTAIRFDIGLFWEARRLLDFKNIAPE